MIYFLIFVFLLLNFLPIRPPRKVLNKWQFIWVRTHTDIGWTEIEFGVVRITSFPEEGKPISADNYEGFWSRVLLWSPIFVKRKW
jgi:hypothetical protein